MRKRIWIVVSVIGILALAGSMLAGVPGFVKEFQGSLWPSVSCKYDLGAMHRKWERVYCQKLVADTIGPYVFSFFAGGPDSCRHAMTGQAVILKNNKGKAILNKATLQPFGPVGPLGPGPFGLDTINLGMAIDTAKAIIFLQPLYASAHPYPVGWLSTSQFIVGCDSATVYYCWVVTFKP